MLPWWPDSEACNRRDSRNRAYIVVNVISAAMALLARASRFEAIDRGGVI